MMRQNDTQAKTLFLQCKRCALFSMKWEPWRMKMREKAEGFQGRSATVT